jgi:hypothetical protein
MRLLYLDLDEIKKLLEQYDKDTKALKDELFRICWYMRGGITIGEAYLLSFEDRNIIGKIIESNLETTKESGLPFF